MVILPKHLLPQENLDDDNKFKVLKIPIRQKDKELQDKNAEYLNNLLNYEDSSQSVKIEQKVKDKI